MIYLYIIALGWFVVEFEPIQILIDYLRGKTKNNLLLYLLGSFNCWQCMTFWGGLILTGDFFTSALASLGSLIIETWLRKNS